jgi:predicted nucleotidyltransferase
MVTIRIAKERIVNLVKDLRSGGFNPSRAILFGSVAKGRTHSLSDIDVALWDEKFTGCTPMDYEHLVKFLRNYSRMELHTFHVSETAQDNPFIAEIEKHGIEIEIPDPCSKDVK